MSALPKFDRPPVVETVIGLQFKGLQKFSTGHAGLFSKQELGDEWFTLIDGHPLDVRYEEFGDDALWQRTEIEVRPAPKSGRLQIVHCADDRMIQVQNSRFLLNWRKRDNRYPTFEILHPQFQQVFAQFDRFIEAAQLGPINPDQWEITYVNHIPIGTLWKQSMIGPMSLLKFLGLHKQVKASLKPFPPIGS